MKESMKVQPTLTTNALTPILLKKPCQRLQVRIRIIRISMITIIEIIISQSSNAEYGNFNSTIRRHYIGYTLMC